MIGEHRQVDAGSPLPYTQPRSVRAKWNSSSAENSTLSVAPPMPTTVVWPPRRVDDHAVRIVAARPTHSNAWSAPNPPVRRP